MCIVDSISRLIDGVITKESISEESFDNNLLEYPQYTEPYEFNGQKVPEILYSGNHEAVKKWRKKQALKLTRELRQDLFDQIELTKQDKKLLQEIDNKETGSWETEAIKKGFKSK